MKDKHFMIVATLAIILLFSITGLISFKARLKQSITINSLLTAEKNINKFNYLINYKNMNSQINAVKYATNIKKIYLTFDDGPSKITPLILDILDNYDIKATFFINNVTGREDILKRMVKSGHTIGNHNYLHSYRTIYGSDDIFWNNYHRLNKQVLDLTGYNIEIMRFPGGTGNAVSKINPGIMTRLTNEVKARNIRYFDWNATNGDGIGKLNADQALNITISSSKHKNFIILFMHDSSTKKVTSDALPKIIEYYKTNGYIFDRLSKETPQITQKVQN